MKKISEKAFYGCKDLRSVTFGGYDLEEIEPRAFYGCGLESFAPPFSLKKIGAMAFGNCPALKDVKLNNGIKELGPMCLWATGVSDLKLPKGVHMKPEQLGLDQKNPDVLRIPASLKKVGDGCFQEITVKKVIVSSAVKELGDNTFKSCSELSEVVFEPNSHLEKIGSFCFYMCKLEKIVIPKKVKSIEAYAFSTCSELSSFTFEAGSRLKHIGSHALEETQLTRADVRYPMTLKDKGHEYEW